MQLSQFSVAAWFKTSANFGGDAFIVNKGGFGSESAGQNLNYGIWMASTEQIIGGFETSREVTSSLLLSMHTTTVNGTMLC